MKWKENFNDFKFFRVPEFILRLSEKAVTELTKPEESPFHPPFWKDSALSTAKQTQSEELSGLEKIWNFAGTKTSAESTSTNRINLKSWKLFLTKFKLNPTSCNLQLTFSRSTSSPCWRTQQFRLTVSQLSNTALWSTRRLSAVAEPPRKWPLKLRETEKLIPVQKSTSEARREFGAKNVPAARRPSATSATPASILVWRSPASWDNASSQKFPNALALPNRKVDFQKNNIFLTVLPISKFRA